MRPPAKRHLQLTKSRGLTVSLLISACLADGAIAQRNSAHDAEIAAIDSQITEGCGGGDAGHDNFLFCRALDRLGARTDVRASISLQREASRSHAAVVTDRSVCRNPCCIRARILPTRSGYRLRDGVIAPCRKSGSRATLCPGRTYTSQAAYDVARKCLPRKSTKVRTRALRWRAAG